MMAELRPNKAFYGIEIPSDWEVKRLFELTLKIGSGITPTGGHTVYKTKGRPFLRSQNVGWGTLLLEDIVFIDERTHRTFKSTEIQENDVFLNITGASIGRSSVANHEVLGGNVNQHVCILRTDLSVLVPRYLNSFILSPIGQNLINSFQAGGNRQGLNFEQIKSFKIPLPPLPEQRAIAQVLSTADAAIHTTDKLIAQKEQRKKWLMQNLLTGKMRLKGFEGEWKEIHIKDLAEEVSIRNKTDKQLTVLSCTKHDGLVPSLEYFGRKIFADDLSAYKVVPRNHFAYATNHIEEGSIGYQDLLDEALISPMYTVFKTDTNINDEFFYKLLKSHPLVYQYQNRMEGSIDRRGGLRWDGFAIIKVKIPVYEEQTAIAQVLQTADKEINLLKGKAEKLREQKKGLMQVLLTGKRRIR